jgi:hypothetical protein
MLGIKQKLPRLVPCLLKGTPSCNSKYSPVGSWAIVYDEPVLGCRAMRERATRIFCGLVHLIAARARRLLTATRSMHDCARVRSAHPEAGCSCLSCGAPSASVCQNGDPGGQMRALVPSHKFLRTDFNLVSSVIFQTYLLSLDCRLLGRRANINEHPSGWQIWIVTVRRRMPMRVIRVETLSQSAKALLPAHKCGGCHH